MSTVFVKTFDEPPIDRREILRYAGVRDGEEGLSELLEECLSEAEGQFCYKVCYAYYPVSQCGDAVDLGFARVRSAHLAKHLADCDCVAVFAATVGLPIDRLIAKYGSISPVRSLLFQALGTERIEALCDAFCKELAHDRAKDGFLTRPRFSAGYGDIPLALQKDIFSVLDCPRKIGLALSPSLFMSPSKSVTALVGITKETGK